MRADFRWLAAGLATILLAGCTPDLPLPSEEPTPSPTPTARDFTVSTSGPIRSADPAVALGDTDALIATRGGGA